MAKKKKNISGRSRIQKHLRAKGGPPPGKNRHTFSFTDEEVRALVIGLRKHGAKANKWAAIMLDSQLQYTLRRRNAVALKDKVRNMREYGSPAIKAELNAAFEESAFEPPSRQAPSLHYHTDRPAIKAELEESAFEPPSRQAPSWHPTPTSPSAFGHYEQRTTTAGKEGAPQERTLVACPGTSRVL